MGSINLEGNYFNQTLKKGRKLLKIAELCWKLGNVSKMFVWRHANELPKPIKIGSRRFWFEDEVDSFLAERAAARGPGNG